MYVECIQCRQSLFFVNQIDVSVGNALLLQAGDVPQITSEDGYAAGLQPTACDFAQSVVDSCWRHPVPVVFAVGYFVVFVEILYGWWNHLEVAVVFHDGFHLVGCEPPLFVMAHDECICLSIEGFVVGFVGCVNGCSQLHADEAAVADISTAWPWLSKTAARPMICGMVISACAPTPAIRLAKLAR